LQSAQVEVRLNLDAANPKVMANKNQLKQVFINLLVNAMHAMEKDPKVLEISTRVREAHTEAVIRDSGVGIPQENLHRIFEPFYTTKSMGTGLGLSISYGIVKDHKGAMEVESQESRGTCFTVRLPRLSDENLGYNLLVG
jgi:C4-dicarboxylate-specific signal transduction histidine kinase